MQKVLKLYKVHQLSLLINLINHGHFVQEFLDSISNTCTETLIFYKKAKPFQDGPQVAGPTKLTSIKHAVENVMSILSSCKVYFYLQFICIFMCFVTSCRIMIYCFQSKIDTVLVSGIQLFCTNELKSSWPVFITPSVEKLIYDNFSSIREAKVITDNLLNQHKLNSPGMNPLCHEIGQVILKPFGM